MDKCDCIDIDTYKKRHAYNPESGTNVFRFLILWVSSINRVSEFLRISSLMTSSNVCPGFRSWWTVSHVLGQTGILFVAHSWAGITGWYVW